jgi:hypothetical protein
MAYTRGHLVLIKRETVAEAAARGRVVTHWYCLCDTCGEEMPRMPRRYEAMHYGSEHNFVARGERV